MWKLDTDIQKLDNTEKALEEKLAAIRKKKAENY